MKFYIKCQNCNNTKEIERTKEIADHVHHLECNCCPKCDNEIEEWEQITCDEHGEAIDDGWI